MHGFPHRFALIPVLLLLSVHFVSSETHAAQPTVEGARVHLPADFHQLPGPQAVQPMPSEVIDPNPEAIRMRFFSPPLDLGVTEIEGVSYHTIRLTGEAGTAEPGAPDLPRVTRLLMVANTGNVAVSLLNQSHRTLTGITAAPRQMLQGDTDAPPRGVVPPNPEIYGVSDWYPSTVVEISEPVTLRDVRFVVLQIHPVQVNPVTQELRVYDEIEVLIENTGGVGLNEIQHNPISISPDFKRLYQSFENFAGSSLDELPVLPGKYLAICPDASTSIAQTEKLVTWKKQRGLDASYVTTTQTGTTAASIRTYIRNQFLATNGQLEYVCLVGDPNGGTGYIIPTNGTSSSGTLDNYFGVMNSGEGPNPDPVPDIAVGRLSCGTGSELSATVAKTVNYESAPYTGNPNWFTSAWCAVHTQAYPEDVLSNPSTKEYTRQIMLQHGVSPVYWNQYYSHITTGDITSRLTAGISVFNHRMSYISQISNSDVNSYTPYNAMSPFVMSITCGTGNFYEDGTSEEWLCPSSSPSPTNPRGAIGCVGLAGSGTHVQYNNIIDAGTMWGIYVLDIQTQGVALIAGKLDLYRNYQQTSPSSVASFCAWSNLMGDPAVPVWRHFPRPAVVTRPASLRRGANNVSIMIRDSATAAPLENALVCLWKGAETYSRGYTDASGFVNLPCSTATTGYMKMTITRDDMRPYLDSIQVVTSTGSLALYSVSIDDDNIGGTTGNNNDTLNCGEIVDLSIRLTNTGTSATVSGITGTLTTASPGVSITQATSAYPSITVGGTGNPTTPFRAAITSVFHREPVTFFLSLTSSAGAETVRVDLVPYAPDVAYIGRTFYGPGGNIDPGESGDLTVTFRNSGGQSLVGAQGILRSLDPFIYVSDSFGYYGNVGLTTATNDTGRFRIEVSPGAFNGHRAVMELVITDAHGFRDSTLFDSSNFFTTDSTLFTPVTTNFVITIGNRTSTSPSGPDGYGYYAFDNTETQPMGVAATYEWVEIGPGGPGTSLNFSDTGDNLDVSATRTLPFPFTFYGQSFNEITICSNGWLAFGSYPMTDYRNYRMGTALGPPYMVAAYWDDLWVSTSNYNVYYYFDSVNHRYIVQWRARTLHTQVNEYFQVILYDPAYYPSATGDGKIKVQYQVCSPNANTGGNNDNAYASVGIQNGDHSIGLDYYYGNQYGPGAATLQNGLAIVYTTDASGQLISSMIVTQPNGGENWYAGQTHNIQWQTTGIQGLVNIELNRNYPSGNWEMLFAGAANSGTRPWTVTTPAATGTARIRVTSVDSPEYADTSDASFSISLPSLTLLSPNGGEYWPTGSLQEIEWSSAGLALVQVEINRNYPSGNWEVLSTESVGGELWQVTGPATSNARIRILGALVPSVGDTTEGDITIGLPPVIVHQPRADAQPGQILFVATVTDDEPGFVTRLFYHEVGAGLWDSLEFAATGNPNEFAATIPHLNSGRYEYYLRATDPQSLYDLNPDDGTFRFDVGDWSDLWTAYDDGTAENYNWVSGPDFQWAVKFEPDFYPYALSAGRFAICPTCQDSYHNPIIFRVLAADGNDGLPGTVLFADTTGCAGNVVGGLPDGAAWASVVTRVNGEPLQLNSSFYLSVQNIEPRTHPSAFAHDTLGSRSHRSYIYDACDETWYSEDAIHDNTRPGNRMIRACGFSLASVEVTITRTDSAGVTSARLRWNSTGAPYYRIYSAPSASGSFDTLEGTISGVNAGLPMTFTDTNAMGEATIRFYRVIGSDTP